jgi:hypothetical protein
MKAITTEIGKVTLPKRPPEIREAAGRVAGTVPQVRLDRAKRICATFRSHRANGPTLSMPTAIPKKGKKESSRRSHQWVLPKIEH